MSLLGDFSATCAHCDNGYLRWERRGGRYRLVNAANEEHDCAKGRAARRRAWIKAHPAARQAAAVRRDYHARLAREG